MIRRRCRGVRAGVPADFERIVRRCLMKDPAARYQSAAALGQDLKRLTIPREMTRSQILPWTIAAIIALALVVVVVAALLRNKPTAGPAFNSMRLTRLATRGAVWDVTISRDGKLLAYILNDGNRRSIWIREISGSNERVLVKGIERDASGIMLSPENAFLYYRQNEDGGALLRVPVKGGTPERIISDVSGAVALSPDGKRIAFVRLKPSTWEASLMIAGSDGSGESALETVRRPHFLDERGIAWSPDGQAIACFAGDSASDPATAFHLVEVSLRHPGQRIVTPQLWAPRGLAWPSKGNVLIVTAATAGDRQQLWMVRHDTGEVSRLTNDFGNYGRVSVTDDGKSMVTVQIETSSSIWATTGNDLSRSTLISASALPSPRIAVDWTPDGEVIYNDPADGYRNIWRMDATGANPQRLTSSPHDKDELVVTRDGRYIVYQQDPNIWRVESDGSDPIQLTHGRLDVHPEVSPDGKSVVYASFTDWAPGIGGEPSLWRVSIDGGEATRISPQAASIPSVSPDGKLIACIHFPGKDPRLSPALLAVMKADGSGGFTIFQQTPSAGTTLSWSPDGRAIDFVSGADGIRNIWRQPLNGGAAIKVTHFDRDDLIHFSWSREGRLLCTRGNTTASAIMIQNFR